MKLNKLLTTKIPNKVFLILGLLIVLIAAVSSYIFIQKNFIHNYAEETAKPLESALIKAGAVKVCSRGDSGEGPSNREPWYGATFKFNREKAEAVDLVYKVTARSGYKLVHASPTNRGFLGSIADEFINNWYYSENKDNPYDQLYDGKVNLSVVIYGEGAQNDCDQSMIATGESTIGLGVHLPEFKR